MNYSMMVLSFIFAGFFAFSESVSASGKLEMDVDTEGEVYVDGLNLTADAQGLVNLCDQKLYTLSAQQIEVLATNSTITKIDLSYNSLTFETFGLLWEGLAQNGRTGAVAVSGKMNIEAIARAKKFGEGLGCYRWFVGPDPLR